MLIKKEKHEISNKSYCRDMLLEWNIKKDYYRKFSLLYFIN